MRGNGEIRKLVASLDRGVLAAEELSQLSTALLDVLGGCALSISSTVGFESWRYDHAIPEAWSRFHVAHRATDPGRYRLGGNPPGTWYLVQQDSTAAERDIELFHGLPAHALADVAVCRLYSPFADDLFMGIYRPRGERPFDEEDRALLDLLYPHIAGALATKRALACIGAPATLVGALEPTAHVFVSFPGPRIHFTRGGRRVFESALGNMTPQGWRRVEGMLGEAAQRFSSANIGGRSQRVVADIRAEMASVPPKDGETRRLLVLLHREREREQDDGVGGSSPAEELLSPVERAVARAAAEGRSAKAVAATCGLTFETTRWYLKSIYEKLGVHNRVELAMLIGRRLPR